MTQQPMVFHVDDDTAVRQVVQDLLRTVGQPVVGFGTARQFLQECPANHPGCLLLDVRLPDLSGLELLRCCRERHYHQPVVVLTGHGQVSVAVAALKMGVVNYLEKPCGDQELLDNIQQALDLDARQRQARELHESVGQRLAVLTEGEQAVVQLMLAGKGYKMIAAELGVSYKTVEARRTKIMQKMSCDTMAELLALVLGYRYWLEANGETDGVGRMLAVRRQEARPQSGFKR